MTKQKSSNAVDSQPFGRIPMTISITLRHCRRWAFTGILALTLLCLLPFFAPLLIFISGLRDGLSFGVSLRQSVDILPHGAHVLGYFFQVV